jgi:hypothetical protein
LIYRDPNTDEHGWEKWGGLVCIDRIMPYKESDAYEHISQDLIHRFSHQFGDFVANNPQKTYLVRAGSVREVKPIPGMEDPELYFMRKYTLESIVKEYNPPFKGDEKNLIRMTFYEKLNELLGTQFRDEARKTLEKAYFILTGERLIMHG